MTTPKMIFISHATKDDTQVDTIAQKFQLATHTTWVDHHGKIPPGTPDWDEAIRKAIVACDVGVLVMTANALTSRICRAECLLVQQLGKPLYIIHAEKCKPENVWLYIKMIQYADVIAPHFDRGMDDLIRAINGETDPVLPTAFYPQLTGRDTLSQYLPYLDTPLRGRSADVDALRDMLKQAGVTQLIGVGGLGKSRISAEIALAYPNGVIWHRCMNTTSRADMLSLMRTHLRLADDAPEHVILEKMQEKKPLVVLDNAEDVVNADQRTGYIQLCNQLAHYGVPILLNARAKWDDQQPHRLYEPKPLTDLASASQIVLDFSDQFKKALTHDQAEALAKSARLHPKLIEFSVGLIGAKGLAYADVIRRLNELTHKDIQKALYEMITKTLDQMKTVADDGENAYALIHNLTWLQATFPEAIIDALKPATITTRDEFIDALATLGSYQFVRHNSDTDRYSIPDLVRETIGTPKDPALFGIYADFYTGRAKEIFVDTPIQHWADKEGEANFDDVVNMKALGGELMRQTQNGTVGDLVRALEFAVMTKNYVFRRMEEKAWAWLEMGLSAVQILRKADADNKTLMRGESLMLSELGTVYQALGQMQKSLAYKEQSLPLARALGDRLNEATALNNIGRGYYTFGKVRQALTYFEEALAIYCEVGDRRGEALTLNNIGGVYNDLGDKQKELTYYEKTLLIIRELGDRVGEAMALNNIGAVYNDLGEAQKALTYYEYVLPICREVGDKHGEAMVLNNIGGVHGDLGDKQKKLDYYQQALEVFIAIDAHPYVVSQHKNIAVAFYEMGRLDDAIRHQENAIRVMKERNLSHTGEGDTLADLERDLAWLKGQQSGGGGATPSDNRIQLDMNELVVLYQQSEGALRQFLKEKGLPDNAIEQVLKDVVQFISQQSDVSPQASEFDALIARLADIYKQAGEDGLRQMLTENNVPEAQIEEIVAVVVAHIAGQGGDDEDESADMLPFETVREWVTNTYTVIKRDTHELAGWREQLDGAKMRMVGMGDDWANEVAFVEALLAVLRGEAPVLPAENPYHEPVRQLVEALK